MKPLKFLSGMLNCHLPGVHSFVLEDRKNELVGMKRIFYTERNLPFWKDGDGADFNLAPHNHRQDVSLTLLKGEVINYDFHHGEGQYLYAYKFKSALLEGKFTLEQRGYHKMWHSSIPLSNTPLYLGWNDVHTITASAGSIWLVEEGQEAPPDSQFCYSVSNHLRLKEEGLYIPLKGRVLDVWESHINYLLEEK